MKNFLFLLLTFLLATQISFAQDKNAEKLKACGTGDMDFKIETDKTQHPTPDAPADKALIYVLRPTMIGFGIQSKFAVDGEWKGVNRGKTYFYLMVDPGEHYFCSQAENQDWLKMTVEAGRTYYLQQKVQMGFFKARTNLVMITTEEGVKKLKDVNLSVFEKKQK